jgi:hypothetical protein
MRAGKSEGSLCLNLDRVELRPISLKKLIGIVASTMAGIPTERSTDPSPGSRSIAA